MRRGERLLNSLERRFGGLALPGIIKWLAGFEVLGFLLALISPGLGEILAFDSQLIMSGQVWRLLSWIACSFVGGFSAGLLISVLFMYFFMHIMWMFSDIIEGELGVFRCSFYIGATIFCIILVGFLVPSTGLMQGLLGAAILFAAATYAPNHVIYIFLIIPVKLKWLAWLTAGLFVLQCIPAPLLAVIIILGLVPYLFGIFPRVISDFRNRNWAAQRRARFNRQRSEGQSDAFHTCHNCGITDAKDPNMEFRVSADDGEEYCLPCRERRQG